MRAAILVTLVSVFVYSIFIPVNLHRGLETLALANAVVVLVLIVNLALLAWHRIPHVAATVAIVAVLCWFLLSTSFGGVEVFFWIYLLPWVLLFFYGLWGGVLWSIALTAYFAFLLSSPALEFSHQFVPLTILLSFVAVSGLAATYEYLTRAYRRHIVDFSVRDTLTGAWNRRKFEELADLEIARCRRYGRPCCLLLIDLDNFKKINDTHGHIMGDRVLREMAASFKEQLRENDHLFRWGGDEFIVLSSETSLNPSGNARESFTVIYSDESADDGSAMTAKSSGARSLAEKLLRVAKTKQVNGICLSVSIGIAEVNPEDSAESLVQRADRALYTAKNTGRNRIAE